MTQVRRQHVVSQVLLRRWAVAGELTAVNLLHGEARARSPRAEAFVPWFVRSEFSTVIERLWQEVESEIPKALDLVANRSVFEDNDAVVVLKSLLAMHFVRARHTQLIWAESLRRNGLDGHLANIFEMANDPDFLAGLHRDLTGLHAVGDGALDFTRQRLLEELERRFGLGGEVFVEQLLDQYRKVLDFLLPRGIEIGVAAEGEYLIGDNPASTYDRDRGAAGLRAGANIGASDTIILPLDPEFVLAAGGTNSFVEVGPDGVELVNWLQVITSVEKVYVRPGSHLDAWVLRKREEVLRSDNTQAT